MHRGRVTTAIAIAAVAAGGAAITTSASARPEATSLKLSAPSSGALRFNTKSLRARSGRVTITLTNPSSTPHAIFVNGKSGKIVSKGKSTITLTLKKGKYTFLCPVGNHAAQGMKGTLTVS